MDKDILMFLAQAADAMPSQTTASMRVKAEALSWLSEQLEAEAQEKEDAG